MLILIKSRDKSTRICLPAMSSRGPVLNSNDLQMEISEVASPKWTFT